MPLRESEAGAAKLGWLLTALAEAYFFSVATMPPERWSCVERGFALDDSRAGSGRAASSAAADLGNGIPLFTHVESVYGVVKLGVCWGCVRDVWWKAEWWLSCAAGGAIASYINGECLLADLSRRR